MASNSTLRSSQRFEKSPSSSRGHHVNVSSASSSSLSSSAANPRSATGQTVRSRAPSSKRSATPTSKTHSVDFKDEDAGRVRVAVRVRPRNAEDLLLDADFADCTELQPELKRLILRKNNWSSESYRFDEVFTRTASQKRVYEVVAKPVVESVLNGYNGTVMAYGQTGTGKTYTVGSLGRNDASERGIMIRALEDILSSTSRASDSVEISYLQLYMESIQDLLVPERNNIPINEDPKTGEVSVPGAQVVKVQDINQFLQLLQIGEINRHAANTKLNTESSRSHAILMVYVRRIAQEKVEDTSQTKGSRTDLASGNAIPLVRKSKLLIVDLAGSERLDKSGSDSHLIEEAKFINLSLTSLGKCINALAENSPHIPTRDSKLTRLLRDSFGGSARTSLIITIGPSARYLSETTSTIMFGQRAMKIVNMVKLKEEFDYESLCRKLENQVDHLTAEVERQKRLRENEKYDLETQLKQCQETYAEAEKNHVTRSELLEKENAMLELEAQRILTELNKQKEHNNLMHQKITQLEMSLKHSKQQQLEQSSYQKLLDKTTQTYEKKIATLLKQIEDEHYRCDATEEQLDDTKKLMADYQKSIQQQQLEQSSYQKVMDDTNQMYEKKIEKLVKQIEDERSRSKISEEHLDDMKKLMGDYQESIQQLETEITACREELEDTTHVYEKRLADLKRQLKDEHGHFEVVEQQLQSAKMLLDEHNNLMQGQKEVKEKLQVMSQLHVETANELESMKAKYKNVLLEKATLDEELNSVTQRLHAEQKERRTIEAELVELKKSITENSNDFEDKRAHKKDGIGKGFSLVGTQIGSHKSNPLRDTLSGQRASIAKLCEEVGLSKILELLSSEDLEVQIQAVKVVANLAAEDIYQERIVKEGGLDALLSLLLSSQHTNILRVASGALANLAMNESNQALIMSKGGSRLLANTASKTDDLQTLRMVAGAIANLCGNEKMHGMLKEDGCIRALMEMAKFGNSDVTAQVARGMANFAKCESREIIQGRRKGRSLLIQDGALTWLIADSSTATASARRHIELALCHLSQNEENASDLVSSGAVKELVRISVESTREDIRNLAKKILRLSPTFQASSVE